MTHANARRDESWQYQEQDSSGSDQYRDREYYASEHNGPSAANYPQYHAEHLLRRDHGGQRSDYRGASHSGPPAYRGNEQRYAGPPRYTPQRFGGHEEIRHDSFGYTEVERQPYSFEPYLPYGPDGNAGWNPRPGDLNGDYADYGGPWNGQAYPRRAAPSQVGYQGPRGDHWHGRDDGRYGERYAGNLGGWSPDPAGEHHGHGKHFDPDYHQWRSEQIRKLDSDYDDWRRERYTKFSDDFNNWRNTRSTGGPTQSNTSVLPGTQSTGGTTASADASQRKAGTGKS